MTHTIAIGAHACLSVPLTYFTFYGDPAIKGQHDRLPRLPDLPIGRQTLRTCQSAN